ncbi:MAG: ribulokinase [Rikenellaceae bacterium]|nr:ribulokinase [Rikenellaceae bacterium]
MNDKYVIGIDYGSDSARAVIVNAANGDEIASSVKNYPRWCEGKYCDPIANQYRQHPLDYIEVLEFIVKDALEKSPAGTAEKVVGISFDTTGSTPVFVNENGLPLALMSKYAENPNAMFVLWKDHTAVMEAAEINELAKKWEVDYTKYEGGIYSSEWVWAKMLHLLREDKDIREDAYSWIEHCDWLTALITGKNKPEEVVRSRCAAGHKAMWHPEWGGLPSEEFLTALDPLLAGYRDRLFSETYTSDKAVGNLSAEWAGRLGLSENVTVGVSAFDCHMGAVGGDITPNMLVRAIGTSTCDILISDYKSIEGNVVAGICGQVDGSVVPGYMGLEAGQSGFGDIYAWFKNVCGWAIKELVPDQTDVIEKIIPRLSEEAAKIPVEESTIIAVDWMNGRRTPDASQEVKGAIMGLTLASSAPRIFRALVEATSFGSRAIVERFRREGVEIKGCIGLGGVARKSPFVMQTMADILNMPIKIAATEQTCAFGTAMFAAVAAGIYNTVEEAQKAMGKGFEKVYEPVPANAAQYDELYGKYLAAGKFLEKERI